MVARNGLRALATGSGGINHVCQTLGSCLRKIHMNIIERICKGKSETFGEAHTRPKALHDGRYSNRPLSNMVE